MGVTITYSGGRRRGGVTARTLIINEVYEECNFRKSNMLNFTDHTSFTVPKEGGGLQTYKIKNGFTLREVVW